MGLNGKEGKNVVSSDLLRVKFEVCTAYLPKDEPNQF